MRTDASSSGRPQRPLALWLAATVATVILVTACDALVGGQCAPGFVAEGTSCVPATSTGTAGTAGAGGGTGGSAAAPQGGGGTAGQGGGLGGSGGTAGSGGGTGATGGQGGGCAVPLVDCGGECVDLDSDYRHCGHCFRFCPSGLCAGGQCQGTLPGHVVVIGMNFAQVLPPMRAIMRNAIFQTVAQPPHYELRILDYREHASSGTAANVDAAIAAGAGMLGRTYITTSLAPATLLPAALDSGEYDVLLVHHQAQAPADELAATGILLHDPIDDFLGHGGVVVVLATAVGTNEMAALLTNAGLLLTTGFGDISGQQAHNEAPGNIIGLGVISPFLAQQATHTLTTSELPGPALANVITSSVQDPVVIHKWQ